MSKPSIPKGTRDFSPEEVSKRTYIFDTIRSVFKKYGYQPIETPTMENLSTLTGKYGDEGDQLIFKILNSGDYTKEIEIDEASIENLFTSLYKKLTFPKENEAGTYLTILGKLNSIKDNWGINRNVSETISRLFNDLPQSIFGVNSLLGQGMSIYQLTKTISEKALRYDLTVPFARYVVMHQNEITLPFKRYQIQPVWRADRPQRGRYREFYQCDADVVGSESLLNEAEFVLIYDEALSLLGFKDFEIRINNRKILQGIADYCGCSDKLNDLVITIDKLDKIGRDGVKSELIQKGFTEDRIESVFECIFIDEEDYIFYTLEELKEIWDEDEDKALLEYRLQEMPSLRSAMGILNCLELHFEAEETYSEIGLKGIKEIIEVLQFVVSLKPNIGTLKIDTTLARGLNYYTGAIFEVKTNEVAMGSIGGGGRYDDLTGMFGLKNLTGVGISFGADRIYDVMEELKLFPENSVSSTKVLITHFDDKAFQYSLPLIQQLRDAGISSELYPNTAKMQKQMKYANDKKIPYVIVIGEEEMNTGMLSFKDMDSGMQEKISIENIITKIK